MVYLYSKGLWYGTDRANRKFNDRTGWVDAQQVVEGGGGINESCAGGTQTPGKIPKENILHDD